MLTTHNLLVILLLIVVIGALFSLPTFPYSRSWGPYPSSVLGVVVLVLILLLFFGRF